MPGRKPLGPRLAQHLEGSSGAKERLEVLAEELEKMQAAGASPGDIKRFLRIVGKRFAETGSYF
jgi:hypothetical protein